MDNISDIMINQPTINVGVIGSVSDGKTTITEKLTDVKTQKHSSETKNNITIKLGYANVKIYKCNTCSPPSCYQPFASSVYDANCKLCNEKMILVKHISIVDSPGHNTLMTTMLNGTSIMDTSILVEAINNKPMPASQTEEHIIASNIVGLHNTLICINKMDLVAQNNAKNIINGFKQYLIDKNYDRFINSPIIPIIANHNINIDIICHYLANIEQPIRDMGVTDIKLIIVRSFNVNKPDVSIKELKGGVIGGTILKGKLKLNDKIILYPGIIEKNNENDSKNDSKNENKHKWTYMPIKSTIISIHSENNSLQYAIPGGLLGVQLTIDPSLTAKDALIGNILTYQDNNNYKIYESIDVTIELNTNISLQKNDAIIINSNAATTNANVVSIKGKKARLRLIDKPLCVDINDQKVTLTMKQNNNIHIIGGAKIYNGIECKLKQY